MATPVIPWMGGKRRLADLLIPRFPPHKCYVEVFAGGAALYFLRSPGTYRLDSDSTDVADEGGRHGTVRGD